MIFISLSIILPIYLLALIIPLFKIHFDMLRKIETMISSGNLLYITKKEFTELIKHTKWFYKLFGLSRMKISRT